jgi:prepilin-type N-terminal cleavage/methylation domain-containing protein
LRIVALLTALTAKESFDLIINRSRIRERGNHKKTRAFTLVELVTVVAVGGLLVAVCLPTLTGVREQARVAKCLQNLRAITQAAAGYIDENGTIVFAFPWDFKYEEGLPQVFNLATEFVWGGGVPDKLLADWDPNQGGVNPAQMHTDTYVVPAAHRPLNAYMTPGVWWSDPDRIKGNPARYRRPMLLPDVFQCPSDSTAHVPSAGAYDPNLPAPGEPWFPTWQWWGTSYAINWWWAYFYALDPGVPESLLGTTTNPGILDGPLHRQILESKQERGASEWLLFYENRLNYALESACPRGYAGPDEPKSLLGWHGEQNVHAAGFLDGSARYQRFDTRYVDGPGWTLWPNRPWTGTIWEPYQEY